MKKEKKEDNKKETKEKEVKISTVFYGAGAIICTYIILAGILIYGFGINNALIQKTSKVIPYPAEIYGWNAITLADLNDRTASVRRFYENQDFSEIGMRVDFNTADGQKRLKIKEKNVLNKMIEDQIVENEAKKRGIILADTIISQEVDRKMKEYGSENYLRENMAKLYGWDIAAFEKNIVKPDMYREKLFENIKNTDPIFKLAKEKIIKAKNEFDSHHDFGEAARKYSEGESAKNAGNLGWFSADQMLPEISAAAMELDKGKISDIIESTIGYHIIKIEDKKNEDGKSIYKISQIFVRIKPFEEWLADQEKKLHIIIPLKNYYWDSENQKVEFKDRDLKDFENNLQKNSPNDISVMF